MKGIISAKELAAYISKKFYSDQGKNISPVRLQKLLYFCFAYWGGFVRKGKNQENVEINTNDFNEYLFDEKIEAWVYGPVVPDVYFEQNLDKYYKDNLFKEDSAEKQMIDNVIEDSYQVNDFKLVELSHRDNSWKYNFDIDEQFHNNEIGKEQIVEEYAKRY